jgi:hypothetical protein
VHFTHLHPHDAKAQRSGGADLVVQILRAHLDVWPDVMRRRENSDVRNEVVAGGWWWSSADASSLIGWAKQAHRWKWKVPRVQGKS